MSYQEVRVYHKDTGFPFSIAVPSPGLSLTWSSHATEQAWRKHLPRLGKLPERFEVVEIETRNGYVVKWLVRFPMTTRAGRDLVLAVMTNGFVKTAWANESTDGHRALDQSRYTKVVTS